MSGAGTRLCRLSALAVALYTLFALTAPFEHHDVVCHLKTSFHCTSCTSSVVGPDPETPAALKAYDLPDAGSAVVDPATAKSILLAVRSTGRSPPPA